MPSILASVSTQRECADWLRFGNEWHYLDAGVMGAHQHLLHVSQAAGPPSALLYCCFTAALPSPQHALGMLARSSSCRYP